MKGNGKIKMKLLNFLQLVFNQCHPVASVPRAKKFKDGESENSVESIRNDGGRCVPCGKRYTKVSPCSFHNSGIFKIKPSVAIETLVKNSLPARLASVA